MSLLNGPGCSGPLLGWRFTFKQDNGHIMAHSQKNTGVASGKYKVCPWVAQQEPWLELLWGDIKVVVHWWAPTWQSCRGSAEKNERQSPNPGVKRLLCHIQEDLRLKSLPKELQPSTYFVNREYRVGIDEKIEHMKGVWIFWMYYVKRILVVISWSSCYFIFPIVTDCGLVLTVTLQLLLHHPTSFTSHLIGRAYHLNSECVSSSSELAGQSQSLPLPWQAQI